MSPPCIFDCDEDVSGGCAGRGLLEPKIAEVRSTCFTLPEQWPCSGIIDPQSREIFSQGKPTGVWGGRKNIAGGSGLGSSRISPKECVYLTVCVYMTVCDCVCERQDACVSDCVCVCVCVCV